MLTSRSSGEHDAARRLKTEFLVQLDGAGTSESTRILVLGATNRHSGLTGGQATQTRSNKQRTEFQSVLDFLVVSGLHLNFSYLSQKHQINCSFHHPAAANLTPLTD